MADPNGSEKKSETNSGEEKTPRPLAVDQELSVDDIDAALLEEDPEFLKTVDEIGKDTTLSLSQIIISEGQQALNDEKDAWANSGKVGRIIYKVFPFAPHVSLRLRKLRILIFDFLRAEWVRIKNFVYFLATEGKGKVLRKIKGFLSAKKESLSEAQRNFRYLSWKLKLAFFGILVLMGGTSFFIYRSLTAGVIPVGNELFIPTLERVATEVYTYDPKTESEPFYDNLRSATNMILMPKMVVNLRVSSKSGKNPMGAFEFYLEGMVPEVVIEIKDREVEIRDLMQRVLEEFNFDQAESAEGKLLINEKLKKEVNAKITTGKLKNVWIKTAIVKP